MQIKLKRKHRRYDKYKNTGIPWLSEVPEGWEVKKLKYFADIQTGNTPPKSDEENYCEDGLPWIKPDNLKDFEALVDSKEKLSLKGISYARKIKKNSVLVCGIGTIGKIGIAGTDLSTNQQINSATFHKSIIERFGHYMIFSSRPEMERAANKVVVSIMNKTQQSNIFYSLPSDSEQTAIANYLDEKTTLLDKTIKSKRKQIELLKEKRTSLINRAVTRGIDENVEMKESGVEWIGEVPKGWEIKPLFSIAKEQSNKNIGNRVQNVLSLSYGNIVRRDIETNFGLLPNSFETYQIVEPENIILRLTDLQNDKKSLRVGFVKEMGIITSAYVCLFVKDTLLPRYFYSLLHSYDLEKVFYSLGAGVRQTMKFSDLKRLPIPIPPKKEQQKIVVFLDSETQKIDQIIALVEKSITLLEEYKTSLISNVVTGKIKIC